MNLTLLKWVKAWGKAPWGWMKTSRYRDTLGQIRAANNTASRSATRHLERCRPRLICRICCSPYLTGKCGTRPFLGGSSRRAGAHPRPSFPKMPTAPSASGAGRLTQPPRGELKPRGTDPWGRRKSPGTVTHSARSVPQITRPASATRQLERFRPRLIWLSGSEISQY